MAAVDAPWPEKKIRSLVALRAFLSSQMYKDFECFIETMAASARGKGCSALAGRTPPGWVTAVLGVLDRTRAIADSVPPMQQPMRYGNQAFRTFFREVRSESVQLMQTLLETARSSAAAEATPSAASAALLSRLAGAESTKRLATELAGYWIDSMGNETRIDYGTGHETTFVAWLFCLHRLGVAHTADDFEWLVLRIFPAYLTFIRFVQRRYMLEPAGSHGVWSLDDYQFLPFYFGAAQLVGNALDINPSNVLDKDVREKHQDDYMFVAAIEFIHLMKTGPFFEHSPILYDITGAANWTKVQVGLLKMYRDEVVGKFPIMQHFLFGSLINTDGWLTPELLATEVPASAAGFGAPVMTVRPAGPYVPTAAGRPSVWGPMPPKNTR